MLASAEPPKRRPLLRAAGRGYGVDWVLSTLTSAAAAAILLMLAALIVVLASAAIPSIKTFGLRFFTTREWRPNALEDVPKRGTDGKIVFEDGEIVRETLPPVFGALPVIYGT